MNYSVKLATEILSQTPATLRSLLGGLSDEWVSATEGSQTWSAFDIVGHLTTGEESDWIIRTNLILRFGETRTFAPFDRTAFVERSQGKSLDDLLREFEAGRKRNLETLATLDVDEHELQLKGVHPDFGRVTLAQLLSAWVVHDLSHLAQIARVLAKQYDEAVGPWKAYLPILTR